MSSVPTGDLPESGSGHVELGQDVIASSTSPYVVPEYVTLIGRIQRHVVPRTYIEVGVATGRTLALAAPGSVAIGVDPEPHLTLDLDDGARVFETTSDAFFDEEDVRAIMGNREIDLAFIDGMHRFEFALRDFMNIERLSSRDTVVLIHDCLPVDEVSARRERETKFWTGDVWKLIVCLKEWRPDLDVKVIDAPPSGLGMIRGLDSGSTVLEDHYEEIVATFMDLPFSSLGELGMTKALNVVPNDWAAISQLLPRVRPYPSTAAAGGGPSVWRRLVSRATAGRQ